LAARSLTDAEAFGELYDRYCDRIFRFIYARLRDRATAEDITSETFFKALKGISTYRASTGSFSSWIYQIAKNAMVDHLRTQRPTVSLEPEMDTSDPATPVEDEVTNRTEVARVWKAVDQLNPPQRTVLVLRLQHDLSIGDIAIRMERSEGAIRVLLHRALAKLQQHLSAT
jgi:RNA polymerase sigma-70 factor (ECF subfamily)